MRADTVQAFNEFHINNWLEARGKLPRHRTISKARRAALAGCYRLLDPEQQGSVQRADVQRILRALGFQPATVSKVLANANADEDGLSPGEFTRLCVEAEQAAGRTISTFASPRGAAEAFPLALLMERHRIHDLIDGHVERLERSLAHSAQATATAAAIAHAAASTDRSRDRRGVASEFRAPSAAARAAPSAARQAPHPANPGWSSGPSRGAAHAALARVATHRVE